MERFEQGNDTISLTFQKRLSHSGLENRLTEVKSRNRETSEAVSAAAQRETAEAWSSSGFGEKT